MRPSYVMELVEHVRPPRLDLRNAEIETIIANQDSLRASLPFSARILRRAPKGDISDMRLCNRKYQQLKTSAYHVYSMRGTESGKFRIPHPFWGLAHARIDLKPGVVFFA